MIEHHWSVICSQSIIDRETNNFTLVNTLESVQIKGPPISEGEEVLLPITHELISLWSRVPSDTPESGQSQWRLIGPNGEERTGKSMEIDLKNHARFRSRIRFATLPYLGNGIYRLCVDFQDAESGTWGQVASIPIEIMAEFIEAESPPN